MGRQGVGIILAGGRARRLSKFAPARSNRRGDENAPDKGHDKGAITLDGSTMLARVARRFSSQVSALLLNGIHADGIAGLTVTAEVGDAVAGQLGPLAGIAGGLNWLANNADPDAILISVSNDVPFLPVDLVDRLLQHGIDCPAIAVSGGRRHPTIAAWPQSCREPMLAALGKNQLSANTFASAQHAIEVVFPLDETFIPPLDPFFNVNTPEDVEQARAWLARGS